MDNTSTSESSFSGEQKSDEFIQHARGERIPQLELLIQNLNTQAQDVAARQRELVINLDELYERRNELNRSIRQIQDEFGESARQRNSLVNQIHDATREFRQLVNPDTDDDSISTTETIDSLDTGNQNIDHRNAFFDIHRRGDVTPPDLQDPVRGGLNRSTDRTYLKKNMKITKKTKKVNKKNKKKLKYKKL
tara:strand:+ start:146 stop:721 length:576 start_codon:yes stop_codon:yes gene_type:complete